eukprot:scaffold85417_cov24-Phaeocystis_antarctica.AAC.1
MGLQRPLGPLWSKKGGLGLPLGLGLLAMRQTSDRRQACGANRHGGGGLGQPPADAIEASTRSALGLDGVALRAWRLRRASNPVRFSAPRACTTRAIQSLDWEMTDRQAQICWYAFSEPEDDPSSFAVGGKGLASAAGAADARKNEC